MHSIKGTKTEANLIAAFNGETQSNTKYTLFATKARNDGYNEIANIFEQTAKMNLPTQDCGISISTAMKCPTLKQI